MKKVFALLLSVAMVICMMPSMAFAAVTDVTVTAAGNATTVQQDGTLQFNAKVTVDDSEAETVTWKVTDESDKAVDGATIDTKGVLTVADTVAKDTELKVTATSTADTSKSGSTNVTVTAKTETTKGTLTVNNFTITVPKDVTYDGTAKEVTVEKKAEVTGEVGEITVKYTDSKGTAVDGKPINAGTYTVTFDVAASNDYNEAKGLAAGTLVIEPMPIKIGDVTFGTKTYDGTKAVSVTKVAFTDGEGTALDPALEMGEDKAYTAAGVLTGDNAGNAGNNMPVKVTVTLNDSNYSLATSTKDATINVGKKVLTIADRTIEIAPPSEEATLPAIQLAGIPKDAGTVTYAYEADSATGTTTILADTDPITVDQATGAVTVKLKDGGSATNAVTIPVKVTTTNYKGASEDYIVANVVVTLTDKPILSGTCEDITVSYTGDAVAEKTGTATATVDGQEVTVAGTWKFDGSAPTDVADSGSKIVTFTPTADADKDKYATLTDTITVTINPVDLKTITVTSDEITEAKKLSSVKLTATGITGVKDEAVTGTVVWDAPDTAAVQGTAYNWTFTPDSTNYNVKKGNATPWKASTPTPGGGGGLIVTDPLPTAKNEATNAVQNYVKPADYEEAEAAEIKAIMDKAAADIKNAKTAEEVKAIEAAAKEAIDKIDTAEEKAVIRTVEATKFRATSKRTTLNGKKAIKITWNKPEGVDFDGYDIYRSTKQFSGFGKKPFFTTTKQTYTNNKGLEVGKTYYYKVRAFKYVNGRKVYSEYSYKAIRTMK